MKLKTNLCKLCGRLQSWEFFRRIDSEHASEALGLYSQVRVIGWFRIDVENPVSKDECTFKFYSEILRSGSVSQIFQNEMGYAQRKQKQLIFSLETQQ